MRTVGKSEDRIRYSVFLAVITRSEATCWHEECPFYFSFNQSRFSEPLDAFPDEMREQMRPCHADYASCAIGRQEFLRCHQQFRKDPGSGQGATPLSTQTL